MHGTGLQVAYFDHRIALRDVFSADTKRRRRQRIHRARGSRKHVLGYLRDFLFSPGARGADPAAAVRRRRNRLLLAKLFAAVEPAGDGQADQRPGRRNAGTARRTAGGISRRAAAGFTDREFIDNVVTSTLVLEGNGYIGMRHGGRRRLRQRPVSAARVQAQRTGRRSFASATPTSHPTPSRSGGSSS